MENQISATQVSLPKGGGAIQGIGEKFQPSEFIGTATLSIPIKTSPCRGFEPTISIDYSSGSGNGSFGVGFNLSIPKITRKTSKGLPTYDGSDTFLLFNGDDLVPLEGSKREAIANNTRYTVISYRPRTEGIFATIEQWIALEGDSYWRIVSRDNTTSIFGKTESSRIFDPENPHHIFEWHLSETFNPLGNCVVYEYKSENNDNVPNALHEVNRSQTANKYIKRIKYGNVQPYHSGQEEIENWLFEIVFDYGEYNLDSNTPYTPVGQWTNRQDSFSVYQAGFEIRTHRLCRSILMFHHFETELGKEPILVNATRFFYNESPVVSLMSGVESVGYSYENGQYQTKKLPPLEFAYTEFQPKNHSFEPLLPEQGETLPALDLPPNYSLIDLYGEGIPGILYSDGKTTLYLEPSAQEKGKDETPINYSPPRVPQAFPIERNVDGATEQLMDVTGNGQLNLVVSKGSTTGYYEAHSDRTWQNFQTFPDFPTDFNNPENQLLDMTGDGLTDIMRMDRERIWIYPGKGKEGFDSPFSRNKEKAIPLVRKGSQEEILQFTDIFGTGMQHLLRVTNGMVECWPHLGYGKFSQRVLLDNVPRFGDRLDASRLFLGDIDGSGTTDLMYVHPDRVEIWFNQSGNSFSEPISIYLPSKWDRLNQIRFADIYGNGTTCLVFSDNHIKPRHWCYDFCQRHKPYLLNEINNNLGSKSTITYCSSTKFYLGEYLIEEKREDSSQLEADNLVPIRITHGYSRDHRPDLKQFIIDLIVSGDGDVPIYLRVADGNENDKAVFGQIASDYKNLVDFDTMVVSDSALYTQKNLKLMENLEWLSRVPFSLKQAKQLVSEISSSEFTSSEIPGYCHKKVSSNYGGIPQRWLVVESSKRKESDLEKLQQKIEQEKKNIQQKLTQLIKKEFTSSEGEIEILNQYKKKLKYYFLTNIEVKEVESSSPQKTSKKLGDQSENSYQITATLELDREKVEGLKRRAGRFVLATNRLNQSDFTSNDILRKYKEQQSPERGFAFLKDPLFFADSVFLKSPQRIETMAMLMGLCLLVYSLGQRQLRISLKEALISTA